MLIDLNGTDQLRNSEPNSSSCASLMSALSRVPRSNPALSRNTLTATSASRHPTQRSSRPSPSIPRFEGSFSSAVDPREPADLPNIYQLVELHQDPTSRRNAEKVQIKRPVLRRLLAELSPSSLDISEDEELKILDQLGLKLIGVYGSEVELISFLQSVNCLSEESASLLASSVDPPMGLRPGLYLALPQEIKHLSGSARKGYIVFWPKPQSFRGKINVSANNDRIMFMRYLSFVTDQATPLISAIQAEAAIWSGATDTSDEPVSDFEDDEPDKYEKMLHDSQTSHGDHISEPGFTIELSPLNAPEISHATRIDLVSGERKRGVLVSWQESECDEREHLDETWTEADIRLAIGSIILGEISPDQVLTLGELGLRELYPGPFLEYDEAVQSKNRQRRNVLKTVVQTIDAQIQTDDYRLRAYILQTIRKLFCQEFPSLGLALPPSASKNSDSLLLREYPNLVHLTNDMKGRFDFGAIDNPDFLRLKSSWLDSLDVGTGTKTLNTLSPNSSTRIPGNSKRQSVANKTMFREVKPTRDSEFLASLQSDSNTRPEADRIRQRAASLAKDYQREAEASILEEHLKRVKNEARAHRLATYKGRFDSNAGDALVALVERLKAETHRSVSRPSVICIDYIKATRQVHQSYHIRGQSIERRGPQTRVVIYLLDKLVQDEIWPALSDERRPPSPEAASNQHFDFSLPEGHTIKYVRLVQNKCLAIIAEPGGYCVYIESHAQLGNAIQKRLAKQSFERNGPEQRYSFAFDHTNRSLTVLSGQRIMTYEFDETFTNLNPRHRRFSPDEKSLVQAEETLGHFAATTTIPRKATPGAANVIVERIFNGERHTATFPGSSQYAQGGSSACGLASMNAIRLAFEYFSNIHDKQALVSSLISEDYVKSAMEIASFWPNQAHLEVEQILELPLFARSLQVIEVQYREAHFRAFSDAVIALQNQDPPGPRAVFLTRPPEMIAVMYIPVSTHSRTNPRARSFYLVFDSHPRPNHPDGTAVQIFPSYPTDDVADYLADLFQVDPNLINDPTLDWHVQLLGQVSCHILGPVGGQEPRNEYATNMGLLELKQQLADTRHELDASEKEKRQLRTRLFDLEQEATWLANAERKRQEEIRRLKTQLAEKPQQPQPRGSFWGWGEAEERPSAKGKEREVQPAWANPRTKGVQNAGNDPRNNRPRTQSKVVAGAPSSSRIRNVLSSHRNPPAPTQDINPDDIDMLRSLELAMSLQQEFENEHMAFLLDHTLAEATERPKFECGICGDNFTDEAIALVEGCEHSCCRECMRGHVESKIRERRYPIPCPFCVADPGRENQAQNNTGFISPSVVENLGLTPELIDIYIELQLAEHSVVVQCQRCSQSTFIDRKDFDLTEFIDCPLPGCTHRWCKHCSEGVARGETHSCAGTAELETLMNQNGWKRCPGCRTPIERTIGCNHMSCTIPNCNTHFCYQCGDVIIQGGTPAEVGQAKATHFATRCPLFEVPPEPEV